MFSCCVRLCGWIIIIIRIIVWWNDGCSLNTPIILKLPFKSIANTINGWCVDCVLCKWGGIQYVERKKNTFQNDHRSRAQISVYWLPFTKWLFVQANPNKKTHTPNDLHIRWLLERELFKIINLVEYVIIVHRQTEHINGNLLLINADAWIDRQEKKGPTITKQTRAYNSHHFT